MIVALATMKNEGAFLLEWVAHYKALGFDDLVICTNDCMDGTDAMVLRLQEMGLARHIATRVPESGSIQRQAYRQARKLNRIARADWLWTCDADEFLTIHLGDGSIRALIDGGSPEAQIISVPWRVFGAGTCVRYEDRPVTQQFTLAETGASRAHSKRTFCKSLVRDPGSMARIGIHTPLPVPGQPPLRREGPARMAVRPGQRLVMRASYRGAQVNHYALRSLESFLVKRDRGRVNHVGEVMDLRYWQRFDLCETPCHAIRRYDPAAQGWRARLLADPALADLHGQAVAWHRARIAALRQDDAIRDFLLRLEHPAIEGTA